MSLHGDFLCKNEQTNKQQVAAIQHSSGRVSSKELLTWVNRELEREVCGNGREPGYSTAGGELGTQQALETEVRLGNLRKNRFITFLSLQQKTMTKATY